MRSAATSRGALIVLMWAATIVAGACSITGGTLGGREKCWDAAEQRAPSLWRGILRLDGSGDRLETAEGEVIPLVVVGLGVSQGEDGIGQLVQGSTVVARAGDDVSLFGGAGADGALVVCAVEAVHERA